MPVITQVLDTESPGQLRDIAKVLDVDGGGAATAKITAWRNAGEVLYCGVFNGHVVALMRLRSSAPGCLQIIDVVVREVTRGRGVGRQLLKGVLRNPPSGTCSIECDITANPQLASALADCGFSESSVHGHWRHTL